jgi:hypothetical protein
MQLFKGRPKSAKLSEVVISWPVESNRPLFEKGGESPSLGSMHSLSSGSAASPRDMAPSRSSHRSKMSFSSSFLFSRNSVCSTASCEAALAVQSPGKAPSQEALDRAGDVSIFDAEGNSRPFRSLYEGPRAIGEQQLIIFVRHFFCGVSPSHRATAARLTDQACQDYLRELSKGISLNTYFTLPVPTSITIIGLGNPGLIPAYRKHTGTPFPIFTDPSRQLHRLLGMGRALPLGKLRKQPGASRQQVLEMRRESRALRGQGGPRLWMGGEFLLREGAVAWCNRMGSYRGHATVDAVKRLLGVDG